jgi:hypothetical protein
MPIAPHHVLRGEVKPRRQHGARRLLRHGQDRHHRSHLTDEIERRRRALYVPGRARRVACRLTPRRVRHLPLHHAGRLAR